MHEIIAVAARGLVSRARRAPTGTTASGKYKYGATNLLGLGQEETAAGRAPIKKTNLLQIIPSTAIERTSTLSTANSKLKFNAEPSSLPGYKRAQQAIQKIYRAQRQKNKAVTRRERDLRHQATGFERVLLAPKLAFRDQTTWIAYKPLKSGRRSRTRQITSVEAQVALLGYKMKSWVQILTTPTADTPGTTLLLHFDNKRYLLGNVSEGTQRACIQRKVGLLKVEDIFMTGKVGWHNVGGLLGMILTIADGAASQKEAELTNKKAGKEEDSGSRKLVLHGPENLTHLLATARRFVFRQGMPLEVDEIRAGDEEVRKDDIETPTWSDVNIKVWAMAISPDVSSPTIGRKRSYDEISNDFHPKESELVNGKAESLAEMEDRYDQLRRGIVGHMFDSDWRLDTLKKIKLSDVQMPAAIFVRDQNGKIEQYSGPLPGSDEVVPDIEVLVRTPWPGATIESLPPTKPAGASLSYIIKNHPQRGKFNPKEAIRLGLKPGFQFRELTMGKTVTTDAGDVITPEMVLGAGKEGGGVAVVELPSISYVEDLVMRKEWSSEEIMTGVGAIVWILGKGVHKDERLKKFMADHAKLQHIISSSDLCPNRISMESPATAAVNLNLIDSERFQIPIHGNEVNDKAKFAVKNVKAMRTGETIQLEPAFEITDKTGVDFLNIDKVKAEASQEVLKLAKEARQRIQDPAYLAKLEDLQKDLLGKDAEVITLGTGSALPSKYRNVSATLVRVPGYGSYLFDCGENTIGQLKRVFGSALQEVLSDLKVIWISHLHADHHLGTVSVIAAWHAQTSASPSQRLIVASDDAMLKFLFEYAEIEDFGHDRIFPLPLNHSNNFSSAFTPAEQAASGLTSIQACPVAHCNGALAVVFAFPSDFKIAYSGDCRPSSAFARLGKGATLLIHEATFDDELAGDALAKKHCTTSEALGVAAKMGARRVVLTHFSQRYQKIPVMTGVDGEDRVVEGAAVVAFDYMRCKVGDLAKLVEFREAVGKLYEAKEDK